jgi:hypothetical protein
MKLRLLNASHQALGHAGSLDPAVREPGGAGHPRPGVRGRVRADTEVLMAGLRERGPRATIADLG